MWRPPTPLNARLAKAVICQSGDIMNPFSWSALMPVFLGAQQEDDQHFPDTDRSALKGVLKHWAEQYYLCSWQTRGHISGSTLIWSNCLLASSLAWMSSLKIELLPRKCLMHIKFKVREGGWGNGCAVQLPLGLTLNKHCSVLPNPTVLPQKTTQTGTASITTGIILFAFSFRLLIFQCKLLTYNVTQKSKENINILKSTQHLICSVAEQPFLVIKSWKNVTIWRYAVRGFSTLRAKPIILPSLSYTEVLRFYPAVSHFTALTAFNCD